jgi:hypothetical protein
MGRFFLYLGKYLFIYFIRKNREFFYCIKLYTGSRKSSLSDTVQIIHP